MRAETISRILPTQWRSSNPGYASSFIRIFLSSATPRKKTKMLSPHLHLQHVGYVRLPLGVKVCAKSGKCSTAPQLTAKPRSSQQNYSNRRRQWNRAWQPGVGDASAAVHHDKCAVTTMTTMTHRCRTKAQPSTGSRTRGMPTWSRRRTNDATSIHTTP